MIPTALDVLHQLAASDGARPAAEHLHDDGSFTRLSYGRLARTVASAARALHLRHGIGRGHVVGIAVPDGLDMIVAELATWATGAAVVPMDGFHLDNALLEARGLLHRKGAAETFDADGFCHLVGRIARGDADIVYPVFDRRRDIAIAGAVCVKADVEFVLFEGNYLLLQDAPWSQLAKCWSYSIWINTPVDQLETRLTQRWLSEGLSELEARTRADENDLANARFVGSRSRRADLILSTEA